jgi:hypothetical protein
MTTQKTIHDNMEPFIIIIIIILLSKHYSKSSLYEIQNPCFRSDPLQVRVLMLSVPAEHYVVQGDSFEGGLESVITNHALIFG